MLFQTSEDKDTLKTDACGCNEMVDTLIMKHFMLVHCFEEEGKNHLNLDGRSEEEKNVKGRKSTTPTSTVLSID